MPQVGMQRMRVLPGAVAHVPCVETCRLQHEIRNGDDLLVVEIHSLESPEAWDQAVKVAPHATLFHTRVWLDFLSRVHRLVTFFGGVYVGKELVGVFPICTRKRGPFRVAGSPQGFSGSMTPYLGPAVPDELLAPTLEAFERWQQGQAIDYTELTLDWEADRAIWDRFHYVRMHRQTVWLQLPSKEELLWKAMTKSCRWAIRKAESQGVDVEEVSERQFFETYADMAADVYSKSHRPPPMAPSTFEAAWDALHPPKLLKVLAARRKQELVAAAIFLLHPEAGRAYYMDGVSYSRHRQLCANNLIQWRMLQYLICNGFAVYDMVGEGHEGVRQFKLSFGGSLRVHDYVFKARTRWARLAREGYRLLAPAGRFLKYHLGPIHKVAESRGQISSNR